MRIVFCFLVSLLFGAGLSHGDPIAEVVGVGECVDCVESKIEPTRALEGLRVSIVCRTPQGKILKTKGVGEFDGQGNFRVSLPDELVEDGNLKEECYAQLQSASAKPCPAHGGLELNRLMLKNRSEDGQKHIFGLAGKLKFSPALCGSETFWHHFKHHHHHFHFNCPPKAKISPPEPKKPDPSPVPVYKKPDPVPAPVYKKPDPVPAPVYKKPDPVPAPVYKKPDPPPVPVYKKPHPSPAPVYKKPHPSPEPVYKKPDPSPVPVYKKPDPSPVPVYKKPDPQPVPYHKPFPKIPKITLPPFHHKSLPPFPNFPHFPRFHHHHHRFHHHHHHFGNFPPLTPPHTHELID